MRPQAIHIELKTLDPELVITPSPFAEPSRAYACGKVILVGEHAVVYGARAVAIPVPSMRLEMVLQAMPPTLPSRRRHSSKTTHSENLQHVLHEALELLHTKPFPLRIEGQSNILFGAGLGASAALCVCILRATSRFLNISLDAVKLASFANQLEKRFHGTPSGLDTTTIALEKALLFKKGQEPQILNVRTIPSPDGGISHAWNFAIIDSGTRSPTLAMVQEAAPFFRDAKGPARIQRFDSIAGQASEALESGNLEAMRDAMQNCGALLHEIGVVPPALNDIIERALGCGALAAKITGAGGGGCILCLLNPTTASDTLHKLNMEFGADKVHWVELAH